MNFKKIKMTKPDDPLFESWAILYQSRFPYQELAPLSSIKNSMENGLSNISGIVVSKTQQWVGFTLVEFYKEASLLAYLAVTPEFEGLGLSRKLVDQRLDEKLNKQTPYFFLEANPKLWSFYHKLGFYRLPMNYHIPEFYGDGVENMGLFIRTIPSITMVSKKTIRLFVSRVFLTGYGLKLTDPRYQQQMKIIEKIPESGFKVLFIRY